MKIRFMKVIFEHKAPKPILACRVKDFGEIDVAENEVRLADGWHNKVIIREDEGKIQVYIIGKMMNVKKALKPPVSFGVNILKRDGYQTIALAGEKQDPEVET